MQQPLSSARTLLPGRLSRRQFLALAAASSLIAGCASAASVVAPPTATPLPRILPPGGVITPENASRLKQLAMLNPAGGAVRAVAWSPDGQLLAAGGATDIYLWNATTGALQATWKGHRNLIYDLVWSRTRNLVASASGDGTARVWDPASGTSLQTLAAPAGAPVYSTAWAPDGKMLLVGTHNGQVLVWDAATWQQLAIKTGPAHNGTAPSSVNPYAVWGVAWSPDGQRIVSPRYDNIIIVWNAHTRATLATFRTKSQPNTVAWAPDGRTFASAHDDGTLTLWDAATYRQQRVLAAPDAISWTYRVAYSPDGALVAGSGGDGALRIWDTQHGAELAMPEAFPSKSWGLAWSPDGQRVAAASDDGTVQLWGIA